MKTEIKEVSSTVRELTVTIEAEKASQDYRNILQKMKNFAQIPGFRKGKAPLKMVEQMYGSYAKEEFLNDKMEQCYKDALQEIDVKPVSQGIPKNVEWDNGKDLVFVYTFEIMPDVEIKHYKNLEIPFEEKKFTEDMLEQELNHMQKQMATAVQPEKLELNDELKIEIYPEDESDELLQTVTSAFIEGEYAPEFYQNLKHAKVGDEIKTILYDTEEYLDEIELEKAKEDFGDDFVNQPFRVKIKSIQRSVLPEINDELAKDLEFDSLDDLKKKIEEELKERLKKENEDMLRGAILERLIQENPFDLPESLILNYAEALAKPYAKAYNTSVEDLIPMYKTIADFNMKTHYIWNELRKIEPVEITEEDKEQAIQEAARNLQKDVEEYKKLYKKEIESDSFEETIIEKKLYEMVKASATFVPYPKKTAETNENKSAQDESDS